MEPITAILGLPYIVSNGRGGWLCSACGGGVRSDATMCKHCRAVFADVARAQIMYQNALQALTANPTNAELRQRALAIGRAYATLTREQGKVTLFDEVALSNDISAATAGAGAATPTQLAASVEERLQALEILRSKGLVSADEYAEKRKRLIDEM